MKHTALERLSIIIAANIIFLLHCAILFVIFFGWYFPGIWPYYMGLLLLTLGLDIMLGYCVLSRWEFLLRRRLNPKLEYESSFSSYYTYKLTRSRISEQFVSRIGFVFILCSIAINLYFHYFYLIK